MKLVYWFISCLLLWDTRCRYICIYACIGNIGVNHSWAFQREGLCFTRSQSDIIFFCLWRKGKDNSGIPFKGTHDFSVNWEKFSKDLILPSFKINLLLICSLKSLPSLSSLLTQGKSTIFQLNMSCPSPYSLATDWAQPWRDYAPSMYKDIDSQ